MTLPRFQRTALASEMRTAGGSRVYCCNPGDLSFVLGSSHRGDENWLEVRF